MEDSAHIIGIGKHIFLHHNDDNNNDIRIYGHIKTSPPDFQVDEVMEFMDDKRRLPGMAVEGKISAQEFIAHSIKHPPVQGDDNKEERMPRENPDGDDSTLPPRKEEKEDQAFLSLNELIRDFDARVVPSLQFLQQLARNRLLVQQKTTTTMDDDSATKMVLYPRDTFAPWTRNDRTRIHEYLKHQFPLLQANQNIHVGIDRDWDALLPFLEHPDQMEALLKFVKASPPPPPSNRRPSKKRRRANGRVVEDDGSCSLTVKHGLSKEERKQMHALLSDLSYKRLNSRTITTKDDNGDAKTNIQVEWSQHALRQQESKHNKRGNPHCLCVLRKTGMEHLQAMRTLTRVLDGVVDASSDIGTAGIKDRQAVTHQFVTFRNVSSPQVVQAAAARLDERRLKLFGFCKVNWLLNQGDLVGNKFCIVLRNVYVQKADGIKQDCSKDLLQSRVASLSKYGFVNYFGEQRFGVCTTTTPKGSRSFEIGQAMWQGDYARAIDGILQGSSRPSISKAWKKSKGDATATLRAEKNWQALPRERAVLKGLQKYGNEHPKKALECVPYGARMLWMHAYQSLVWNKAATERIETYGTKVVLGDLFRANGQTVQIVTKDNLSTVQWNQLVLPMPGSGIQYPTNDIGDFYQSLLKHDGISMTNSNNNDSMSSSAKGCYRNLVVYPTDLVCDTSQLEDSKLVTLTFGLPKGSYATMMLREFQRKSERSESPSLSRDHGAISRI